MPILALLPALLLGALSPAISAQSARQRSLGLVTLDEKDTPLGTVVKRIGEQVEVDLVLDKSVDASRLVHTKRPRDFRVLMASTFLRPVDVVVKPSTTRSREPSAQVGLGGSATGKFGPARPPTRDWCSCIGKAKPFHKKEPEMASDAVTLIVPAARLYRQSDIEEIRFSFGVPRKKTFKTTLKPIR